MTTRPRILASACISAVLAALGSTASANHGQFDRGFHDRAFHDRGFHDRGRHVVDGRHHDGFGHHRPAVCGTLFVGNQRFNIFEGSITPQIAQALCALGYRAIVQDGCIVVPIGRGCAPAISLGYQGFTLSQSVRHGKLFIRVDKVPPVYTGCGPTCGTRCVSTCTVSKGHAAPRSAARVRAKLAHAPVCKTVVSVQIGHGRGHGWDSGKHWDGRWDGRRDGRWHGGWQHPGPVWQCR